MGTDGVKDPRAEMKSSRGKWFAVRTAPGAQMPRREYAVESTTLDKEGKPRGKGYRLVPSIDPSHSAIEKALTERGFVSYMPVEFKVVRNRAKTDAYTIRRFPLLPGYVFVYDVRDWLTLRDKTPGVAGVVRTCEGVPLPISVLDIITLRTIEARSEAKADHDIGAIARSNDKAARKQVAAALMIAKRKLTPGKQVKVLWGKAVGREATVAGWADGQRVRTILSTLDGAEEISLGYDEVRLLKEADLAA